MKARKNWQRLKAATGVSEDDVIWFDAEKKIYDGIGYIPQREVLDYVCQEISSELHISSEEVQGEFLKSHFTGHLIKLAKLVEQVFGKGSFRVLAAMPSKGDERIREVLEELKEKRTNIRRAT